MESSKPELAGAARGTKQVGFVLQAAHLGFLQAVVRARIVRGELTDFAKDKRTTDQGEVHEHMCLCACPHSERKSESIHRQVNYKNKVNQAVNTEFAEWKETELLKELKALEATFLPLFWLFVKSAMKSMHASV